MKIVERNKTHSHFNWPIGEINSKKNLFPYEPGPVVTEC